MGGINIFRFISVNFDNFIKGWSTSTEKIFYNVLVLVMYIPRSTVRSGRNFESTYHQKYTILFVDFEQETGIPFLDKKQAFKIKPQNFEYFKQRIEFLYTDLKGHKKYNAYICLGILQEIIGMLAREKEETET